MMGNRNKRGIKGKYEDRRMLPSQPSTLALELGQLVADGRLILTDRGGFVLLDEDTPLRLTAKGKAALHDDEEAVAAS